MLIVTADHFAVWERKHMNKILFVDDDANLLKASQRRLRKFFDVDIAQDGEEGLRAIYSRGPYAVIISDLMMPGMDGFKFLNRARQSAPESVFIMLTGHANLEVSIKALNEGHVFRFLTKPCKMHVLEKAIQAGMEQYDKNSLISRTRQLPADKRYHSKVLIVDDDPEVLTVLSAALHATSQFDVLTAENGQVALTLLNLLKINMVIADREMPEMSGIELLSTVRQGYPDIYAFLMTWQPTPELECEIEALGAMGCFEKPLVLTDVINTLRSASHAGPRGQVDGISTAGFLQMIETEEKTCTLQIRAGDLLGLLFFQKGCLIGAETGNLKNEAAAIEILTWKQAAIEIQNSGAKREIGIDRPLMYILMEAARLQDEAHRNQLRKR
jgi:DNA-binding NtrC family response regulator